MFAIFSGTSDFREALFEFLNSDAVRGFTAMPTVGKWEGRALHGDLLIFFDLDCARATQVFLMEHCRQECVEVISLPTTLIHP